MDPAALRRLVPRGISWIVFVGSAALVAAAIAVALTHPAAWLVVAAVGAALVLLRWRARRRTLQLYRSGDVFSVLARFGALLERAPENATMGPLLTATAFAAYGWVDAARAAIAAAQRGPSWDAALDHRLFLDTLLLAYEGDPEGALENARRLELLPAPPQGAAAARALELRRATGAFARAFAHRAEQGDRETLLKAAEATPLVFWAMRYAAAVASIDAGDEPRAKALIEGAPAWPAESTFRAYHQEIEERASSRLA